MLDILCIRDELADSRPLIPHGVSRIIQLLVLYEEAAMFPTLFRISYVNEAVFASSLWFGFSPMSIFPRSELTFPVLTAC